MIQDATYWEERYRKAEAAFAELKAMTKRYQASRWCLPYRELAEKIHSLGRDIFYVEVETSAVPDATGFSLEEGIKSQGF